VNETHDPSLRSWEPTANQPGHDFPIQNLPYGVFSTPDDPQPRAGVAIGDFIYDLRPIFPAASLNPLMALPKSQREDLRRQISRRLSDPVYKCDLAPMSQARLHLPAEIGDFTDFFASLHHAANTGRLFRPAKPVLPNYKYLPVAYHGRASSIVLSGTPIRRPSGQISDSAEGPPRFGPTEQLDYELELGVFVGPGNTPGEPVPIAHADDHLFGVCLLNDWSARDIQRWESQPLGPFLSKSFATSISPWVIPMEALEPFRRPTPTHDPRPLEYLRGRPDAAFDITLEVWVQRAGSPGPTRMCRSSFLDMYWTLEQMLAHHTSNGCLLRPGDLMGSGTVSGPGEGAHGCLLETGGPFLKDGDVVTLNGWAEAPGTARIGLGTCTGAVISLSY